MLRRDKDNPERLVKMIISPEQENFLSLAVLTVQVIPSRLRVLFKASWQQKFGQPWGDNKASGNVMKAEAKKKGAKYPNHFVEKSVENGDTSEWDSTTLFFALLFSKLKLLDDKSHSVINAIRVRRNECFAHTLKAEVPQAVYEQIIDDIAQNYKELGWDEAELTPTKVKPTAPPTEDLLTKMAGLMLHEKERNKELEKMMQKINTLETGTNERLDRVERKLDVLYKEDGIKDNNDGTNSSDRQSTSYPFWIAIFVIPLLTIFQAILKALSFWKHKKFDVFMSSDPESIFGNRFQKAADSSILRQTYKRILEKWTIPFINDDKEIRVVEKPRSQFMVSLTLADTQNLDKELKCANEIQEFINKLNKSGTIRIEDIISVETRCSFVRGVAGVGKTSLVEHITLSWATENLLGSLFDFVFLIKCRYIDAFKIKTINEDFKRQFGIDPEQLRACGERVLVIIDGLDEVADLAEVISRSSVINLLLRKDSSFIPGHYTIITGRPHVEPVLRQNEFHVTGELRIIEVIGLVGKTIVHFVENFCNGNSQLKDRILEFINSSPSIAALATIPQYLNSLCCILAIESEDIKIEKTSTLYIWIFVSFIRHHIKEFNKFPFEILKDENVVRFLKVMSKISYDLLMQNKIVFKQGDFQDFDDVIAKDEKVAMMLESFIIKKKSSTGCSYQYRHLTLHEFLAAVHCFREDIDIDQLLDKNLFQIVTFVAGFVSAERTKTDETIDKLFVRSIGKATAGYHPKKLSSKVIAETVLQRFHSNSELYSGTILNVFHELFDAKDTIPMTLDFLDSKFYFNPLISNNCMLLIHLIELFLKNNNRTALSKARLFLYSTSMEESQLNRKLIKLWYCFQMVGLKGCSIETTLVNALKMSLVKQKNSTSLNELVLYGCDFSYEQWRSLAPCVPFIEKFTLWDDEFDEDCCQLVVNVLREQMMVGQCYTKLFRLLECDVRKDVENCLHALAPSIEVNIKRKEEMKEKQVSKLKDLRDVKWRETSMKELKFRSQMKLSELLKREEPGKKSWPHLAEKLHFGKDQIETFRKDGEPVLVVLSSYSRQATASIPALFDALVIIERLDCCLVLEQYMDFSQG